LIGFTELDWSFKEKKKVIFRSEEEICPPLPFLRNEKSEISGI